MPASTRQVSLRLNRKLGARLGVFLTRRPDGRAVRPKDPLKEVCSILERYLRLRQRAARRDPHLFGPHAQRYYHDTVRLEQEQREIDAALERVYGPDPDVATTPAGARHSIWTDRYYIQPGKERLFRKWFREQYGS